MNEKITAMLLDDLTDDALFEVLLHLLPDELRDLHVNKRIYRLSRDNYIWKKKLAIHFPNAVNELELQEHGRDVNYFLEFKERYIAEANTLKISEDRMRIYSQVKEKQGVETIIKHAVDAKCDMKLLLRFAVRSKCGERMWFAGK